MSVQDFTLSDVLSRNAHTYAERTAVVSESGEEISFRQLEARVDALAAGLAAAGFGEGDRLAILALNSAAYLELYLAGARLGTVLCPINWRLSPEEVRRLIERTRPRGMAVDRSCRQTLPCTPEEPQGIELFLHIDDPPAPGFTPLAELYRDGEQPPASPDRSPLSDAPFAIIATAAVDVIPRGAVLTHRNLIASNLQEMAALGIGPDDRTLLALPLFHIAALGHCLAFLHAGAANVVTPKYDAGEAVRLIDRHRITHLSDFPPVLANLLDAARDQGSMLSSLKHVTGLDSPETIDRLHRETGADFWIGFGQAETTGFVTLQRARERPGASGRPCELSTVRLFDDYDREVAIGTPGEIVVRGPLVFAGYDGQPEVTEYTFRGGWHHTGDIGRFDEDGYLHYVKRKAEKELIKPGGENVYPAEVETVIVELEQVSAACVFGVPDAKWGEAIKAVVETSDDSLTAATIAEHVASRIARFKKPQHVELTSELPRSEDGSVDRDAVKERWG